MRSMHMKAQETTSRQLLGMQAPQSCGQIEQVSKLSHLPFGHTEQTPQSCWQEAHVSVPLQMPSPQPMHLPQSSGQVKQFSVAMLQTLLPHDSHAPQSGAQERQS